MKPRIVEKVFHKRTRKGAIVKVVRELYLRDDIPCGISTCPICVQNATSCTYPTSVFQLSNLESVSTAVQGPHLLLIDWEVMVQQCDLLDDYAFANMIIPQTAWDQVKKKNPPAYKKMNDFVFSRAEKRCYVFMNEFCSDTYTPAVPKENSNDRCGRAISNLGLWYQKHLDEINKSQIKIVLLCNDDSSVRTATDQGLMAISLRKYVEGIPNRLELVDKLASTTPNDNELRDSVTGRVLYPAHKTMDQLQSGLKTGGYKQGGFQVNRDNYLEAFVFVREYEDPVLIKGRLHCNRAVQGDCVAIEMLPKNEWTAPAKILRLREMEESNPVESKVEEEEDEEEEREQTQPQNIPNDEIRPTGKVVGIIRRNWRQYCGILLPSVVPGARRHLFCPAERRIPRIRIETRQIEVLKGQRLVVSIDSWPRNSRYPLGHYVRALGDIGDRMTDNQVLLLENDVPHDRFSQSVSM